MRNAKFKILKPILYFLLLSFAFWNLLFLGCIQKKEEDYAWRSQVYYRQAIRQYKGLILKGKDLDRLHFKLGRLYYNHGEFEQAIEELKKTSEPEAKKFLAITYYRLGNFTDALDVFDPQELQDDEYLYYYGLTCEKLNLFDAALKAYKKIKAKGLSLKAGERINEIEKQVNLTNIKQISPQVAKILSSAPSPELYPQAGALLLFCDEKIEISPKNTQVAYLHYVIKILNERGKEDCAETQIDYDSTYEKIELEYARTIKPDGTVVEVGSRHIRDVSKYLNFPLYSNARVYIISFPEITIGAAIEYKVKIYRNQLINKKDFILSYPIQATEPIITANLCLSLPKGRPLHLKVLNDKYNNFGANLSPRMKEKDDCLIYTWQFKDIPQIIPESNMPPEAEINPTLFISTFDSWQDVYRWWWELAKDKIKADKTIKDKVGQLIKNQSSPEARARVIYNFCAQEIRYVAVEYGQAGHEPHLASDIFRNKYGDCKDQAILLVTMLKEAGFCAWPVLISTKEYYNLNEDVPSAVFNHCIVALASKDKIIFLDPTQETCPFGDLPAGDQGRKVLVFKEDGYEIHETPLYLAEHNLIKQQLNIKVNTDETIEAEKSIFTYGIYDQAQRFWLLYTPPELVEEKLKEKIQGVSIGARLDKYSIKNLKNLNEPLSLHYTFRGPEYFTSAGNLRIMPQLTAIDTSLVAKDTRKYPIDFGILDSKETYLEIEIPKIFVITYIPESINEDSPWLRFKAKYNRRGNKLYFSEKIELKKNIILENDYFEFKKFFTGLAKRIKQRIILEKGI